MNVFVRARARTCVRIARARALNFQAASRARTYVRLLRSFACVSGLLRVREGRHASIARTHLERRRVFLFKDVLYVWSTCPYVCSTGFHAISLEPC